MHDQWWYPSLHIFSSKLNGVFFFMFKLYQKSTIKTLTELHLSILWLNSSFILQMILHKQIRAWTRLQAPRPWQTLPQLRRVPVNVARTPSFPARVSTTVPPDQHVYWDRPTPTPVPLPTVHCYVTTIQVHCIYPFLNHKIKHITFSY